MWVNVLKFLKVSHHFAKFSEHRPCGSDTEAKIFYMTLRDHMIKGSSDFVERSSSLYIPTLPKLINIDIVLMNTIILVFHVILQDHMIVQY